MEFRGIRGGKMKVWQKVNDRYDVWVRDIDEKNYEVMLASLNHDGKWAYVRAKVNIDGKVKVIDKGKAENPWSIEVGHHYKLLPGTFTASKEEIESLERNYDYFNRWYRKAIRELLNAYKVRMKYFRVRRPEPVGWLVKGTAYTKDGKKPFFFRVYYDSNYTVVIQKAKLLD